MIFNIMCIILHTFWLSFVPKMLFYSDTLLEEYDPFTQFEMAAFIAQWKVAK